MKHIALLAALLVPYCVPAMAAGTFEFDIPQNTKENATKAPAKSPASSKANIAVVKPEQVKVAPEPAARVAASPAMVSPAKPVVVATPAAKEPVPAAVQSVKPAVVAAKEVYRVEDVAKAPAVSGAKCAPTTVAMTFHNVPTQKGPYFHRWVSLGCQADEVNFVREGNEQYSMHWKLAYVPADERQTARYSLTWKVKGVDTKGAPLDHEASHVFNLDNARTLSLTNNMAVSLRKVP